MGFLHEKCREANSEPPSPTVNKTRKKKRDWLLVSGFSLIPLHRSATNGGPAKEELTKRRRKKEEAKFEQNGATTTPIEVQVRIRRM